MKRTSGAMLRIGAAAGLLLAFLLFLLRRRRRARPVTSAGAVDSSPDAGSGMSGEERGDEVSGGMVIRTKGLKIKTESSGEAEIEWEGEIEFREPAPDVLSSPISVKLVDSSGQTIGEIQVHGSELAPHKGKYEVKSGKGERPEIELELKPKGDKTWEFEFEVEGLPLTAPLEGPITGAIRVGDWTASEAISLREEASLSPESPE